MAATVQPKIFKKYEIIEGGGHHGGGWKVAYADFMTAMMAFFLLMWILASSDEAKLAGIAEYFTNATQPGGSGVLDGSTLGPPGTLSASNGNVVARGSELGKIDDPSPAQWEIRDTTPISDAQEKAIGSNEGDHENPAAGDTGSGQGTNGNDGKSSFNGTADSDIEAAHALDDMKFKKLQKDIMQAMQDNPDLDPLKQNVIFEQTPEGLHIQIIDQEGKPMFQSGRADMAGATNELLNNLGTALAELPNRITLAGHTDAVPFADGAQYDNWDLSSDRANATRRVFEAAGVNRDRVIRVSGMADTDLLVPENPTDPSNRRISIMVQYQDETDLVPPAEEQLEQAHTDTPVPPAEAMQEGAHAEPSHGDAPANVLLASDQSQPAASPIGDQVLQNLRDALR
jgi:chemotaxis protein MotB